MWFTRQIVTHLKFFFDGHGGVHAFTTAWFWFCSFHCGSSYSDNLIQPLIFEQNSWISLKPVAEWWWCHWWCKWFVMWSINEILDNFFLRNWRVGPFLDDWVHFENSPCRPWCHRVSFVKRGETLVVASILTGPCARERWGINGWKI